jgi:cobalt/nickel transport system permease protein
MMPPDFPLWLKNSPPVNLPAVSSSWPFEDYLEKTLGDVQRILAEDAHSLSVHSYPGLMQSVEPHIKLLGIAALLLAAALTKNLAFLLGFSLLITVAAHYSGICLRVMGLRVWLPALIFAGISVLPGITNWVTPGTPIFILFSDANWQLGPFQLPAQLTITRQGLQAGLFVILRCGASLGCATLVIKTTRWSMLTKVLAKLGLSAAIIAVLDLSYRYMYLFLFLLMDYILGRKSRLVGRESQVAKIAWIGGTISDFYRITRQYSQDIHDAMQARGYCYEQFPETTIRWQAKDLVFLLLVGCLCYFALGGCYVSFIHF